MNNIQQQQNIKINQEQLHSQSYQQSYFIGSNELEKKADKTAGIKSGNEVTQTNSSGNFYLLTQDYNSQQQQNTATQMAVKQPIQKQYQFINTNDMQQLQQNNLKYITTNTMSSNSLNATQRVIVQQPQQQQTAYIVPASNQVQSINNTNNVSQMYLNINNRIVPIQTLNLKQNSTNNITIPNNDNQMQRFQIVTNNTTNNQLQQQQQLRPLIANQQQQQQITNDTNNSNQPQYFILSNNSTNLQPISTNTTPSTTSLNTDISEKMRELELIQNQLRAFQQKLSNDPNNKAQTTLTQQQIQAMLTVNEHSQLQNLLQQKKTVQAEIQRLQQKLLSPATTSTTITDKANTNQPNDLKLTFVNNTNTPLTKLQLYQQLIIKLNNFKNSKTATSTILNNSGQKYSQELRLTPEEFENFKKLTTFQTQLEKELNLTKEQIVSIHQKLIQSNDTTTESNEPKNQSQTLSTIKLSELSLSDKYRILDLVKKQLLTLKTTLTNLSQVKLETTSNQLQQQEQLKEKYSLLIKKQTEIQTLIQIQEKEESNNDSTVTDIAQYQINDQVKQNVSNSIPTSAIHIVNSPPLAKQAPIKIRNVITTTPSSPVTSQSTTNKTNFNSPITTIKQQTTPLRSIVLNNNVTHSTPVQMTQVTTDSNILPLAAVANLQKLHFPNVQFKCLNFDELAQHSLITKQTDETTIDMLKELDEKASQLINVDQVQTFAKNQVKLARKYLEQQISIKQSKRRKFQEQLNNDHRSVLEQLNFKTDFHDKLDAIKRLTPYHVFQKTLYEPTEEECSKFDECFEEVSEKLLKTADAMKKRFHLFQLRSMQKEVVSSEETLMLKLFVDDLKQNLETEKKKPKELENLPRTMDSPIKQPTEPQSTIRQLLNISNENNTSNNINNDFNLISNQTNPLKRHLKTENSEFIKQQNVCDNLLNSNDKIELKYSPNLITSSFFSSSSEKRDAELDNEKIDLSFLNKETDSFSSKYLKLDDDNSQLDKEKNNHLEFNNHFNFLSTNKLNSDEDQLRNSASINISGLDDFILNEDEFEVQNELDY